MTFEDAINQYDRIICGEIRDFRRRKKNPKIEFEDLKQECLLKLWEIWSEWQKAEDMSGFCRETVRNLLTDLDRTVFRDALYNTVNYGLYPPER